MDDMKTPEAIRALKPPTITVLPPADHSRQSVSALSSNGKES